MPIELLSHPAEGKVREKKLTDHLSNVAQNIEAEIAEKKLNLNLIDQTKLKRIGLVIGLMHDFGKATTFFQNYLQENGQRGGLTFHSLISAISCHAIIQKEFEGELSRLWAYAAFHIILGHHGNLTAFDMTLNNINLSFFNDQRQNLFKNYGETLKSFYRNYDIDISTIEDLNISDLKSFLEFESDELIEGMIHPDEDRIEFFFIVNFLFSLLIDYDKHDAARLEDSYFKNNLEEKIINLESFIDYNKKKDPKKFNPLNPINQLRNEFLSEIYNNANISKDNHFYTITAPTGIGKTFGCLAFADKLKQQLPKGTGRIIYCLPYTSIIDQNYLEFESIINHSNDRYRRQPSRYLLKHHCLTEKKIINRTDSEHYLYKDYLDDRLLVESWQAAVIVTTFVQFFHSLIGNRNRFLKKFHNIINAIVILDEVQNIDPDYHQLINHTFNIIGERFNTYLVLVTATQPKILENIKIVPVVNHEKYMCSDIFNRVRLSVKPELSSLEKFIEYFLDSFNGRNCLIVVNTKKHAQALYRVFENHFTNYEKFCLTTKLTPNDRTDQINRIKNHIQNNDKVIVVSTQLVEAGVDLSFKTVYRDFGPMDSIVQVAGRCNRNGEYGILGGEMILMDLSNHRIYKPILIQHVNKTINQTDYESKDFLKLSDTYFNLFHFKAKSNKILSAVQDLNYDKEIDDQIPISKFTLIDDQQSVIRLFILTTIQAQKDMEALQNNLKLLKKGELSKEDKDNLFLKIEKLKYHLNRFSISEYKNKLMVYKSIIEPHDIDVIKNYPYRYISYKNQDTYAYDEKLGLLDEPKIPLSESMTF